jgi:folate-dependent phosphoribosylglycinamide formyltransferase PurN
MNKRIVLLAGPGSPTNILYHAVAEEFAVERVIWEDRVGRSGFLRRRIAKLGLAIVVGQVAFRVAVVPWLKFSSAGRVAEIKREFELDESPIPESAIRHVPSVNSDVCIETLRNINPAAVVVSGTRIISAKVLDSVPAPFINLHGGITPLYRGVHGAYWALVERRREACGVTVHLVDTGIDTGNILGQATIDPTPQDNFVSYGYLQLAAGIPLLKQAVHSAIDGRLAPVSAPEGESRLWSHPTITEYLRYRVSRGVK